MDVNGILYTTSNTMTKTSANASNEKKTTNTSSQSTDQTSGVIYERSNATTAVNSYYTQNTALINQLKTDFDDKLTQLHNLVYKLISKQGNVANNADDIWSLLQKGDFTVDQETVDTAQEEISEDGYWGVTQSSDRIISFAKTLTGGDPSKINTMQEAFENGYKEATKSWGKALPEISSKTYDAVMEKFDIWRKESDTSSNNGNTED
jgi:hypothetical protein